MHKAYFPSSFSVSMVFDSNLIDTLAETILRIGEGKETPSIAIGILDSLAQERYFSIRKANTETMCLFLSFNITFQ